jgi:hypothetical protein
MEGSEDGNQGLNLVETQAGIEDLGKRRSGEKRWGKPQVCAV